MQELSRGSSFELQNVCKQMLEELAGAIRFCKYEQSRQGQADGVSADMDADLGDLEVRCALHIFFEPKLHCTASMSRAGMDK